MVAWEESRHLQTGDAGPKGQAKPNKLIAGSGVMETTDMNTNRIRTPRRTPGTKSIGEKAFIETSIPSRESPSTEVKGNGALLNDI